MFARHVLKKYSHYVATSLLNCDKIHISGFRKTWDNRVGDHRTDSSSKINKSELKWYSNDTKRMQKLMKKPNYSELKTASFFISVIKDFSRYKFSE